MTSQSGFSPEQFQEGFGSYWLLEVFFVNIYRCYSSSVAFLLTRKRTLLFVDVFSYAKKNLKNRKDFFFIIFIFTFYTVLLSVFIIFLFFVLTRFCTILSNFDSFWPILTCLVLFWLILTYFDSFCTVLTRFDPFQLVLTCFGLFKPSWSVWLEKQE